MIVEKGARGDSVKSIQETLNRLHLQGRGEAGEFRSLKEDGIFGDATEDAVILFQRSHGLYPDGRVGSVTMKALREASQILHAELSGPIPLAMDERLSIVIGPADKYGDGYGRLRLRSDAMDFYLKVYDEVRRSGGMLTSSGGSRDLSTKLNSNRSATSFHYSGRALDLFVWSGMQRPEVAPYVVKRLGDRRYRVYARCSPDRAEAGSLPPISTVDDAVTYASRVKGVSVAGHFLDLTSIFGENGFKPIRARKGFEEGETGPLGAEWWHFQWEHGLKAGVSTFGDELKRIYPMSILQSSAPWAFKDYVWQKNWF